MNTFPTAAADPVPTAASPRPVEGVSLRRVVGFSGAVALGLGSILGTGVFVSIGMGGQVAGASVVAAIALAGVLATCNALSSAQLAAAHPVAGGTYAYGYRYLTPAWGFLAGWSFLLAKSASAATAALGFAGYGYHLLRPGEVASRPTLVGVAAVATIGVTLLVLSGLRRSNAANVLIVAVTIATLGAFVVAGAEAIGRLNDDVASPWRAFWPDSGLPAFLHATALMFVAYTGYGRLATLGEDVVDPRHTIPRAIVVTLAVSAALYLAVAAVVVGTGGLDVIRGVQGDGADRTSASATPLSLTADAFGRPWVARAVAVGATTAMLGVLLNLVLGLSRVWLAMGREGDVPRPIGVVSGRTGGPAAAESLAGVVILAIVFVGDVRLTWGFSAFTVLIYYAVTNAAALRLPPADRLYPRAVSWAGLLGCLALAFWVPWRVWAIGVLLSGAGWAWHARRQAKTARRHGP